MEKMLVKVIFWGLKGPFLTAEKEVDYNVLLPGSQYAVPEIFTDGFVRNYSDQNHLTVCSIDVFYRIADNLEGDIKKFSELGWTARDTRSV